MTSRYWIPRAQIGRVALSGRIPRRDVRVAALALLILIMVFTITLTTGDYHLSPGGVLDALLGGGSAQDRLVVSDFRLPRALSAILIGGALGISGAVFQTLSRNPLVAPDVIGVNGGAALAALIVIVLGGPPADIPAAAIAGGLSTAAIGYLLAFRHRRNPYRLLIIGVGLNAMTSAGIAYLFVIGSADRLTSAADYLLGSLVSATWQSTSITAIALAGAGILLLFSARSLTIIQLGPDVATTLGVRTSRAQAVLLLAATVLAAVAVAFTGPIGFVAFLAPQIARRLVRHSAASMVISAATSGAVLVLLSDLVAQRLFAPVALPVGVVTVALGGPYFLVLLLRSSQPKETS